MTYEVEEIKGIKIIHIEGDIECDSEAKNITKEISKMAAQGTKDFCFNLEKVTYLNSSGVSIFIHTLAETEVVKGKVYLVVPENNVFKVVELAGLNKLIETHKSYEEFKKKHLK